MKPLDELRGVERATVLKAGRRAGSLLRRNDAVVFAYDQDYVDGAGGAVATTLPVSPSAVVTHAPGALPPFFSGLLPEGRRLDALRLAVKTSADDEVTLLLAVGADTVGDVQVIPYGDAPTGVEPYISVGDWEEVRFLDLFAASVGDAQAVDRVALPGVQDKVSARMINVPVALGHARFVLKLDPPEFPHLVPNEAFFLSAARRSGVESAKAEVVHDADGAAGLLVRRFDRVQDPSGRTVALAQEDACQVLGRYPADKYRVTTEAVIGALAGVCQAPSVAAFALLKQAVFAYLTCNGDAHAKNFSVRCLPDGEWRVTPAYDLPTSHPYGDTTMALSVNGRRREDIGRGDFVALGEASFGSVWTCGSPTWTRFRSTTGGSTSCAEPSSTGGTASLPGEVAVGRSHPAMAGRRRPWLCCAWFPSPSYPSVWYRPTITSRSRSAPASPGRSWMWSEPYRAGGTMPPGAPGLCRTAGPPSKPSRKPSEPEPSGSWPKRRGQGPGAPIRPGICWRGCGAPSPSGATAPGPGRCTWVICGASWNGAATASPGCRRIRPGKGKRTSWSSSSGGGSPGATTTRW